MTARTVVAVLVHDEKEWDGLVSSVPDGHLLQCYRWGELKARYGWTVERFGTREGSTAAAQVLWRPTPLGPIGYIPRGPALGDPRDLTAASVLMETIHEAARSRRAILLKVEPNTADPAPWPALGFRPSRLTFQPQATLIVDLVPDLDTIRRGQHPKARYNTGLAARRGVSVRTGGLEDLPAFFRLTSVTGMRDGFAIRSQAYFRDMLALLGHQAALLLAEHEGDLIAGILVARFNQEAIYLYGASGEEKRNLMPNHLLQWEAMRAARFDGCTQYDLWGIPNELATLAVEGAGGDELPEPQPHQRGDLWGVYRFKRGLGGRLRSYAGAYDYVYNPPAYWLWERALPHLRRLLKRGAPSGE